MKGISALITEVEGSCLALRSLWGHVEGTILGVENRPCQTEDLLVPWSWTTQPPELHSVSIVPISTPSKVFCCGSLNGPRQEGSGKQFRDCVKQEDTMRVTGFFLKAQADCFVESRWSGWSIDLIDLQMNVWSFSVTQGLSCISHTSYGKSGQSARPVTGPTSLSVLAPHGFLAQRVDALLGPECARTPQKGKEATMNILLAAPRRQRWTMAHSYGSTSFTQVVLDFISICPPNMHCVNNAWINCVVTHDNKFIFWSFLS